MSLKIITWNINGLGAMLGLTNKKETDATRRHYFINYIKQFDVIMLQEIRVSENKEAVIDSFYSIMKEEYQLFYTLDSTNKGRAGVATLLKITDGMQELKQLVPCLQNRFIKVKYQDAWFYNYYIFNTGTAKSEYAESSVELVNKKADMFIQMIMDSHAIKDTIFFAGDFNAVVDLQRDAAEDLRIQPGLYVYERAFMKSLFTKGKIYDNFPIEETNRFTFINNKKDGEAIMRIDYILTNRPTSDAIEAHYVDNKSKYSDHYPVIMHYKL